jgi:hypothetical protein
MGPSIIIDRHASSAEKPPALSKFLGDLSSHDNPRGSQPLGSSIIIDRQSTLRESFACKKPKKPPVRAARLPQLNGQPK